MDRDITTRTEVALLREELATALQRLRLPVDRGVAIDYSGFEDRFRGESAVIREAQRRYLSFFPDASDSGTIVDIGCGRGEMVGLLLESGHRVVGVDVDSGAVNLCLANDLPVVEDDGLHYLESLDSGTLKGIFCAQVVEHLHSLEIELFIRLAYERLRPSGVLVVETINPQSLYALGDRFVADMTHVRPVHPETLRYICEQIGFKTVEVEGRSPHPLTVKPELLAEGDVGAAVSVLLQSVFGYQDYVIVATK
jgi:O-antigen chain-terminating methyltransferase